MVKNPPDGYQRMIPYLFYADAATALGFLVEAFGFEEKFRFATPDGGIGHAEVALGNSVVMLATADTGQSNHSPQDLTGSHGLTMVYVDDVDAHHDRAKAAGATITRELEDQFYGDRTYGARDPEGHQWYFAQHVRDVDMSEMSS